MNVRIFICCLVGSLGLIGNIVACSETHTDITPPRSDCTVSASAVIGAAGGSLHAPISDKGPLAGAQVSFPSNALQREMQVTLSWCAHNISLRKGTPSGIVVDLSVDGGIDRFNAPVTLELPDPKMGIFNMPIPYQVESNGRLHVAQLLSYSRINKRLVISVFGPGKYSWSH